jgi:hypothetical protein
MQTALFHSLTMLTKAMAPIAPFSAEDITAHLPPSFQQPSSNCGAPSPIWTSWLCPPPEWRDTQLEAKWKVWQNYLLCPFKCGVLPSTLPPGRLWLDFAASPRAGHCSLGRGSQEQSHWQHFRRTGGAGGGGQRRRQFVQPLIVLRRGGDHCAELDCAREVD